MKDLLKKVTAVLLLVITAFMTVNFILPATDVSASSAMDEIKNYDITVDVNEDGSLNMRYKITWHIISNGDEGPLTWVKIGVPNKNVDNIEAVSSNIKKIKYYKEGTGYFIRVDFNSSYTDGDEFTFEYTFTQYNLFTEGADSTYYQFTPGWFPTIPVDNMTIRWNAGKAVIVEPDALVDIIKRLFDLLVFLVVIFPVGKSENCVSVKARKSLNI